MVEIHLYYFNDGKSAPEKQLNLDRVYQTTDNSINFVLKNPLNRILGIHDTFITKSLVFGGTLKELIKY